MPVGMSARSLPLGVQLVGPRFYITRLLAIAKLCEPVLHADHALTLIEPLQAAANR